MQLIVNGTEQDAGSVTTVAELVAWLNLGSTRIAVELNGEIVPRSTYAQQALTPADRIEIVQAIGGG